MRNDDNDIEEPERASNVSETLQNAGDDVDVEPARVQASPPLSALAGTSSISKR